MQVVEDCSETDGVHSAGTKAKLSIYLSIDVVPPKRSQPELRSPNRNNPNKYHSMPDDTDEYSRADYFNDPYNSRDLNPTEPMDHGCGSRREWWS